MDKQQVLASLGVMSVMGLQQINPEKITQIVSSLNMMEFLTLAITGKLLLDWVMLEGWRDKIPFYIIKCRTHGFQISYPSGFKKELICPKCTKELSIKF